MREIVYYAISVLKDIFEKVKGEVLPSASPSYINQRRLR